MQTRLKLACWTSRRQLDTLLPAIRRPALSAHRTLLFAISCILLALLALGCGSRARRIDTGGNPAKGPVPIPGQAESPDLDEPAHTRLVTGLPSLGGNAAGSEFEFILRATLVEPVFQGNARILFDSSLVEPVAAIHGKDLPTGEIVLARTDLAPGTLALSDVDHSPNLDGCVPFAFTARPGGASLTPGGAELLRIKFRLKQASPAGIPVRLQNDPQFLQLRNDKGQRVAFDLEREAAAQ